MRALLCLLLLGTVYAAPPQVPKQSTFKALHICPCPGGGECTCDLAGVVCRCGEDCTCKKCAGLKKCQCKKGKRCICGLKCKCKVKKKKAKTASRPVQSGGC